MNKELFELKRKVISVISEKTYYGLINFAEKYTMPIMMLLY